MKYLPLEEIEIVLDQAIGNYVGDSRYWASMVKGAYLVNDGVITHLFIWDGVSAVTLMAPIGLIKDTEPQVDADKLEDIYKQLIDIKYQLVDIKNQQQNPKENSNINSDMLIKALAIAQKPELIKDL
jgi:hypothetical protein